MKKPLKFFIACVILRTLLSYFPQVVSQKYKNLLTLFYACIGIGFMYQYLSYSRKKGIFGQLTWWHNLRFWHALNYFLAAYWVYVLKNNNASSILLFDITIGIYFFIRQHYKFDF